MIGARRYGASGERQEIRIVTNKNQKENYIHKTERGWKAYRGCKEALGGLEEQRKPDIFGTGRATRQTTSAMK